MNIQAIFEAKQTWIWYKNCLNCAAIMDIPIVFVSTMKKLDKKKIQHYLIGL